MFRRFAEPLLAAVLLASGAPAGSADEPRPVRVNTFPNAKALPFHAGLSHGIFARHAIALALEFTDNSSNQREGLAAGRCDIAQSAHDNAVAMIEVARKDVISVAGGVTQVLAFPAQIAQANDLVVGLCCLACE